MAVPRARKSFVKAKVIRPVAKRNLAQKANEYLLARGRHLAAKMRRDYERTTRHWEHPVEFEAGADMLVRRRRVMVIFAGTRNQIYRWVDEGARGKTFGPRTKPFLTFIPTWPPSTYVSHTRPGRVTSVPRIYEGAPRAFIKVDWPGIRARGFTVHIREKYVKQLAELQEAIDLAVNEFNTSVKRVVS